MIGLLLSVYRRFKRDIAHAKQIQKKRKTRKETVSEEDSPVFMQVVFDTNILLLKKHHQKHVY